MIALLLLQNTSEKMILGSCVRRMSDTIEKRFCFDLTPEDRYLYCNYKKV